MDKAKVFITGATGTVGLQLTEFLANQGYTVIAGVRSTEDKKLSALIERYPKRIVGAKIDITMPETLGTAMSDCQVVIHTAAVVDPWTHPRDFYAVNVMGTTNVLEASIANQVLQFIHISSLSVITGDTDQFSVDESQPYIYCREAYANSKIEAEKLVRAEIAKGRIKVTILRPGFIYGPYERTWLPKLIQAVKKGRAMLVGNNKKETNVIYIANLCLAIESAILKASAYGQIYNLTDGQMISKKILFDTICDELNLPRVTFTIPVFLARLLVESASLISPYSPAWLRAKLARYSRGAFRLVAVNQGFDISKAERELGYTKRIPFKEGMAKTLAFWKMDPS